jgi:hypothetical protein
MVDWTGTSHRLMPPPKPYPRDRGDDLAGFMITLGIVASSTIATPVLDFRDGERIKRQAARLLLVCAAPTC